MTYRVAVDAGFSCPNRGAGRESPGCSFCGSEGARSPYLGSLRDVESQIGRGIEFLKTRYGAKVFLLYFQAYSNTYAEPESLKRLWDHALSLYDFRELIVSTRPDCLDERRADLLASYAGGDRDVWVELGLQSALPETLKRIGRGHGVEEFDAAAKLLRERGIKTAVHLIFGLPGEGEREIMFTIDFLLRYKPEGIKIHNLHLPRGTRLEGEFENGELSLPCWERHLDYVVKALERLSPDTLVMRFTCDTPASRLAFPRSFPDKSRFLELLRRELEVRDTRQGRLFKLLG